MADNNPLQYNDKPFDPGHLEQKKMLIEYGWAGKIFGSPKNAPINICGLALLLLLGAGLYYTVNPTDKGTPFEFWKLISPLVTGILGFIGGKKS